MFTGHGARSETRIRHFPGCGTGKGLLSGKPPPGSSGSSCRTALAGTAPTFTCGCCACLASSPRRRSGRLHRILFSARRGGRTVLGSSPARASTALTWYCTYLLGTALALTALTSLAGTALVLLHHPAGGPADCTGFSSPPGGAVELSRAAHLPGPSDFVERQRLYTPTSRMSTPTTIGFLHHTASGLGALLTAVIEPATRAAAPGSVDRRYLRDAQPFLAVRWAHPCTVRASLLVGKLSASRRQRTSGAVRCRSWNVHVRRSAFGIAHLVHALRSPSIPPLKSTRWPSDWRVRACGSFENQAHWTVTIENR